MTRVWVIRGGQGNRLVDVFLAEGVTGVGYVTIGDARNLEPTDVERHLVEEGKSRNVALHARMFMSFLREVEIGDYVLMPDTPDVIIGRVSGPYHFVLDVDAERYRHRRRVAWIARRPVDELPKGHRGVHMQRLTLTERSAPELLEYVEAIEESAPVEPRAPSRQTITGTPRVARPRPRSTSAPDRRCPECGLDRRESMFSERSAVCRDCA